MLEKIKKCFVEDRVLYTKHAKIEMETEELGEISEKGVFESVQSGEVIEEYPDAEPYPCCLIYGRTKNHRPIHSVCAYSAEDDIVVVVTVYEPDVKKWIDYRRKVK